MDPWSMFCPQPHFSALGTVPKSFTETFGSESRLDICEFQRNLNLRYFGMKFLWL